MMLCKPVHLKQEARVEMSREVFPGAIASFLPFSLVSKVSRHRSKIVTSM
ncbi:MAG: hypothetical protein OJF50_001818 [Nitrospira sp.]|nr:hypothetical protein [Nitrospira sp.]